MPNAIEEKRYVNLVNLEVLFTEEIPKKFRNVSSSKSRNVCFSFICKGQMHNGLRTVVR